MSSRPRAIIVNNDHPLADYGATHLEASFAASFDTEIVIPMPGFGDPSAWLLEQRARVLVLSGSERSVNSDEPWLEEERELIRVASSSGVAVLAICFGHQLLGQAFGRDVVSCGKHLGLFPIRIVSDDPAFAGLGSRAVVPEWHSEGLEVVPSGFALLAASEYCPVQAMRLAEGMVYGMQFHPCYGPDLLEEEEEWAELGLESSFRHDGYTILGNVVEVFARWVARP